MPTGLGSDIHRELLRWENPTGWNWKEKRSQLGEDARSQGEVGIDGKVWFDGHIFPPFGL